MGGFALGRRVHAGGTAGACVLSASAHLARAWIGDAGANSLGDGWEAEHCARREGTSLTLQMYLFQTGFSTTCPRSDLSSSCRA